MKVIAVIRDRSVFEPEEYYLMLSLVGFALFLPISISISQPFGYLALALGVYHAIRRRRFDFLSNPYFWPVVLFSVLAVMAAALGPNPGFSLDKCRRLLLLALVFPMGWVFGARTNPERIMLPFIAFIAGTSLLAVWDIVRVPYEIFQGMSLYDTGNMRDPQLYMIALCFLIALWDRDRWIRKKTWMFLVLFLNVVGLVIHFKRGVWFSFILVALLMGWMMKQRKVVYLLLLCTLAMFMVPQTRERILMLKEEMELGTGGRWVLWTRVAPDMIKDYPLGAGPRALEHEDFTAYYPHIQPGLNHLHNNILQVAVDAGWVGAAVWIWWVVLARWLMSRQFARYHAVACMRSRVSAGILGAFIGVLFNGMVEYNFGNSIILMAFIFLVGLSNALRAGDEPESEPSRA